MPDDQVMLAGDWEVLTNLGRDVRDEGWQLIVRHVPRAGLGRVPTNAEPLGPGDAYAAEQRCTVASQQPEMPSVTLYLPQFSSGLLEPEAWVPRDQRVAHQAVYDQAGGGAAGRVACVAAARSGQLGDEYLVLWWGLDRPAGASWYWCLHAQGRLWGRGMDVVAVRTGQDYFR